MTARGAYRLGQGIGALVAIGVVIAFTMLGETLRLIADDADHDVLVWFYDSDAAPGQRLTGRAWSRRRQREGGRRRREVRRRGDRHR